MANLRGCWVALICLVIPSQARNIFDHAAMNSELLAKAIPLAQYQLAKFSGNGQQLDLTTTNARRLEDQDDFYVNYDNLYSFSGYSMKYAKCQPVQYFSSDAIEAGQSTPMVTEDIIILRLCPQNSCNDSAQYGCHYNYAEYAISLKDYLTVMLKYRAKKQASLCQYCKACGVVYQGNNNDDAAADGAGQNDDARRLEDGAAEEEDGADQDGDDYYEDDDDNMNNNNNADADVDCSYVDDICYDFDEECGDEEQDENGNNYLDYEGYLDYVECSEVNYNENNYYVRPRCDGSSGSIKMAVYYDNYCVKYAGSDVSARDLGLGFREGVFSEFYDGSCIDCSESDDPPFYNTNSAMCNRIHYTSAKCTLELMYDLFDGEEDDSTECSFIESIRFGTYDEEGKLSSSSLNGVQWSTEVSTSQKVMLGVSVFFCVAFVIYSCYLHHAMTNLLIKSLSHRELLPPSRHRKKRIPNADDWEKAGIA